MTKFILIVFCMGWLYALQAQQKNYNPVDSRVQQAGAMADKNLAVIAATLTGSFTSKEEKARAIYYWIANYIALDPKGVKTNDQKNSDPVKVIELRKATSLGISLLFQEMCSQANIRCLSVDGYVKNFPEEINDIPDEINHSWNVVQLGLSPEEWYYVDAAKGSGYLDKKRSVFTKKFTSGYFFANKILFNLDHYPDNKAWQLEDGPGSLKEFYALPVIEAGAYDLGLQKPKPSAGLLKLKTNATVQFSIPYKGNKIDSIELVTGKEKKLNKPIPVDFKISDNTILFSYIFKTEAEYPLLIRVDGKEILSYLLEVNE